LYEQKGGHEASSILRVPQIKGPTVQNLLAWATWRPEFVLLALQYINKQIFPMYCTISYVMPDGESLTA